MNIILLSGGSGKRLWPLSNDIRSKQFIKIFRNGDGTYGSMVQRVHRQICRTIPDAAVTIATSKTQVSSIRNQLGENVDICVEPCRRDTFPAIALAALYLRDVKGVGAGEPVVVCPVDPYVDEGYFETIARLGELVRTGSTSLALIGIEPTYPSEKYGYIIPSTQDLVSAVQAFKEKPDQGLARKYIEKGALWNGGVFAFKLQYICDRVREQTRIRAYEDLLSQYESLEKISFDYAVAEKEENIQVLRFKGKWKDLGTWNTLTEAMDDQVVGEALYDETCENIHVINELNVPIVCMGIKNAVVAASAEGILVSDKERSSHIKPYVDKIDQQIMFAEKSWGSFQVVDVEEGSMTIKITLNPGHGMNYHSHDHRDEVWTVIAGRGKTIVDGMEQPVSPGDVVTIEAGCRHTIIAETELKVVEVQLGQEISVHDKKKYKLDS